MTATIVRVKRRLEDDPVDALLLSFKRRKSEDAPSEKALLRFAATVEDKTDFTTTKTIVKSRQDLKDTYKCHIPDIVNKQRRDTGNKQKENRYKILSLNRFDEGDKSNTSLESNQGLIVDVDVGSDSDDSELRMHQPKYVYDLYSSDQFKEADIDDGCLEMLQSVQPFSLHMEYRGSEDSDEIDYCDEDSNDEGNYRNDYPDSDNSINEDDMRLAAALHGVGIDDDLSSDTNDELITSMDSDFSSHNGYEAYKKRILRTWREEELEEEKKNSSKFSGHFSIPRSDSSSSEQEDD